MAAMEKSHSETSMASISSDQLDEETLDLEFDVAPYDIMGEHDSVGVITVATKGETLPKTTGYKRKDRTRIPVKFHVNKKLEIASIEYISKKIISKTVFSPGVSPQSTPGQTQKQSPEQQPSPSLSSSQTPRASKQQQCQARLSSFKEFLEDQVLSNDDLDNAPIDIEDDSVAVIGVEGTEHGNIGEEMGNNSLQDQDPTPKASFMSQTDFIRILIEQFDLKVIGGLEAGLRAGVREKMLENVPLLPKENNAVVNSLIQIVCDQFGPDKPEYKFCEKLSGVLKVKFPSTFSTEVTVNSSLGTLNMPKSKGQGGFAPLAKRIGNNFYNRLVRPNIKRPAAEEGVEEIIKIRKKKVKGYCLRPEKWCIDEKASKDEMEEAFKEYKKMENALSVKEKAKLVISACIFIQKQFRSFEPNQVVEDLELFWEAGPEILSKWFEWLTGGSKLGNLSLSVIKQLTKVMNIVENFILSKRSAEFELEMNQVKAEAEERNGNNIMYNIFLLRNLGKLFKNKSEMIIFLDGSDDKKNGPDEKTPNIFITKQNVFGEAEFEEKIVINLRIGDKVISKDLSLPESVAGLIQVFFSFNLCYPPEVDDLLQFMERILCGFGAADGARNKRNTVKKGYRDFEGFAANLLLDSDQGDLMTVFMPS